MRVATRNAANVPLTSGRGGTRDAARLCMVTETSPRGGEEPEDELINRAESAVDRSRNLRQLIVLQRLLRELAAQRRNRGAGDSPASH